MYRFLIGYVCGFIVSYYVFTTSMGHDVITTFTVALALAIAPWLAISTTVKHDRWEKSL